MNDMVDRVASTLYCLRELEGDVSPLDAQKVFAQLPDEAAPDVPMWHGKNLWRQMARATMACMHEPTVEMVRAGADALLDATYDERDRDGSPQSEIRSDAYEAIWRAMLGTAIGPGSAQFPAQGSAD